jgi:hypothetical protein
VASATEIPTNLNIKGVRPTNMVATTHLRSIFQVGSEVEVTNTIAARSDVSSRDKAMSREPSSGEAEMGTKKILEPGELSFDEDTRGGMGRHLGLMSTTFLM